MIQAQKNVDKWIKTYVNQRIAVINAVLTAYSGKGGTCYVNKNIHNEIG